jgi:hypothetical protein
VRDTHDITMLSIMLSIILGILALGNADCAEPDARKLQRPGRLCRMRQDFHP